MTAIIINDNSEKLVRGRSYCSVGFDKCLIQMSIFVEKKTYLCTEGITVFMVMILNQLEFLMARFSRLM